jgi:hypothetical protein
MKHIAPLLLMAALITPLAGCGEGEASSRAAAGPRAEAARVAAEAALRGRLRSAELRGVQVFGQALPDSMVVCGRARGGAGEAYAPYVAIIGFEGQAARVASLQLGASGPEASRVFVEMVDRCFEGGGPVNARVMARAVPPLPTNLEPEAPAVLADPLPTAAPAARMATARTGANIRNAPRGGEVVRSLPAGASLDVMGEAPGGWYQVGERGAVLGWVHASVVEVSAPRPVQVAESR